MIDTKSLGQTLRFLRQARGLTQNELAAQAGITTSYLSLLERGRRDPAWTTIVQIVVALDIPLALALYTADPQAVPENIRAEMAHAVLEWRMQYRE